MARDKTGRGTRGAVREKRGAEEVHDQGPSSPSPPPSPRKRFVATKVEIEGREETKIVELPSLEPEPWGEHDELHVVGQRVPRMDALEKVTGRARYSADT